MHRIKIYGKVANYLSKNNMAKATDSDNDHEEDIQNYQYKIILLGDGAVGKTSIATRFSEEKFSQNYKQTVGVDFFMKRLNIPRKLFINKFKTNDMMLSNPIYYL